jgi:Tol biopolymer transport system component
MSARVAQSLVCVLTLLLVVLAPSVAQAASNRIVYTENNTPWSSIFSINPDGSGKERLTPPDLATEDMDPAVSPDGRTIAFARNTDFATCTDPDVCYGNWDLFLMDADGGNARSVTQTRGLAEIQPAWSPDGRRLAYSTDGAAIFVMDLADPDNPVRVGLGQSPSWSPDGRSLAFTGVEHDGPNGSADTDIFLADTADFSRVVNITRTSEYHEDSPKWSPNGRLMQYTIRPFGSNVAGVAIAGIHNSPGDACFTNPGCMSNGNLDAVAVDPGEPNSFALGWSPDSKVALVAGQRDGERFALYTLTDDLEGAPTLTKVIGSPTGDMLSASWLSSPPLSDTVDPGGTASTGSEATTLDPLQAAVTSPQGGEIKIESTPVDAAPPSGYRLFGQQLEISAPAASVTEPLRLEFLLDESMLPEGTTASGVQIFRDGSPIGDCSATTPAITPVPCVSDRRALSGGDVQVTVLSDHASAWNFGVATNRAPACSGVKPSQTTLSPPNGKFETISLSGATDPDGDSLTLGVKSVDQDEPLVLGGDKTTPDAKRSAVSTSVLLRSERNDRGDGRVYRIGFEVSDGKGATCTGSARVSVPLSKSKPAVDSGPSYDSFGS